MMLPTALLPTIFRSRQGEESSDFLKVDSRHEMLLAELAGTHSWFGVVSAWPCLLLLTGPCALLQNGALRELKYYSDMFGYK